MHVLLSLGSWLALWFGIGTRSMFETLQHPNTGGEMHAMDGGGQAPDPPSRI